MTHAFSTALISDARAGFGTYTKKQSYSEYLQNLRLTTLYDRNCKKTNKKTVKSQSDYLLLRNLTSNISCINSCNTLPFDKGSLQVNLITKEDLAGIVMVQSLTRPGPSSVDPSLNPFYAYYTVDPSNILIGNNPCTVNNYINYMVLNTPATNNYIDPTQQSGC